MWFRTELGSERSTCYRSGSLFHFYFAKRENAAVFIGHSTVPVRLAEQNFLTGIFCLKRLFILKRHKAPGVPLPDLPPLNFILISHGHLDHMDLKTLNHFPRNLPVVLPDKLQGYLNNLGFSDVRALS